MGCAEFVLSSSSSNTKIPIAGRTLANSAHTPHATLYSLSVVCVSEDTYCTPGRTPSLAYHPIDIEHFRCLTYGMCRYAALAHGALRARDGVDSLRPIASQRLTDTFCCSMKRRGNVEGGKSFVLTEVGSTLRSKSDRRFHFSSTTP